MAGSVTERTAFLRVDKPCWPRRFAGYLAQRHLDAHENHLISKVAGLLHVTHGEYIAAKLRAKESLA